MASPYQRTLIAVGGVEAPHQAMRAGGRAYTTVPVAVATAGELQVHASVADVWLADSVVVRVNPVASAGAQVQFCLVVWVDGALPGRDWLLAHVVRGASGGRDPGTAAEH
jgi:hypothetical protein